MSLSGRLYSDHLGCLVVVEVMILWKTGGGSCWAVFERDMPCGPFISDVAMLQMGKPRSKCEQCGNVLEVCVLLLAIRLTATETTLMRWASRQEMSMMGWSLRSKPTNKPVLPVTSFVKPCSPLARIMLHHGACSKAARAHLQMSYMDLVPKLRPHHIAPAFLVELVRHIKQSYQRQEGLSSYPPRSFISPLLPRPPLAHRKKASKHSSIRARTHSLRPCQSIPDSSPQPTPRDQCPASATALRLCASPLLPRAI